MSLLAFEVVETSPEFLDCAILVVHAPGGVSLNAVSIEANRCLSKAAKASMKSCGMSLNAESRMHCTRRSRSGIGNASISLSICSAVIGKEMNHFARLEAIEQLNSSSIIARHRPPDGPRDRRLSRAAGASSPGRFASGLPVALAHPRLCYLDDFVAGGMCTEMNLVSSGCTEFWLSAE